MLRPLECFRCDTLLPHSKNVTSLYCLQTDWNWQDPQNFMPKNTSCTLSIEIELWKSGAPDLQVVYWLVPKQFSHFPAKCSSCCGCSQDYFSATGTVVAVSRRGLCAPAQMESSLSKGGWGYQSTVTEEWVSAGFGSLRSSSYFHCIYFGVSQ